MPNLRLYNQIWLTNFCVMNSDWLKIYTGHVINRVPQIQIKSNIKHIWIWSNQISLDLNLIWINNSVFEFDLIWNFTYKLSNISNIWSNQIKYLLIWIWFDLKILYLNLIWVQIFDQIKSNQIKLWNTYPKIIYH